MFAPVSDERIRLVNIEPTRTWLHEQQLQFCTHDDGARLRSPSCQPLLHAMCSAEERRRTAADQPWGVRK